MPVQSGKWKQQKRWLSLCEEQYTLFSSVSYTGCVTPTGGGEVVDKDPKGEGGERVKAWERGNEREENQEIPCHLSISVQSASNPHENINKYRGSDAGADLMI